MDNICQVTCWTPLRYGENLQLCRSTSVDLLIKTHAEKRFKEYPVMTSVSKIMKVSQGKASYSQDNKWLNIEFSESDFVNGILHMSDGSGNLFVFKRRPKPILDDELFFVMRFTIQPIHLFED